MKRISSTGRLYFTLGAVFLGAAAGDFVYWLWHGTYDSSVLPGLPSLAFAGLMLWLAVQGRRSLLGLASLFAAASLALPWIPFGGPDVTRRILLAARLAATAGATFMVVAGPSVRGIWLWLGVCGGLIAGVVRFFALHVSQTIRGEQSGFL